MKWERILSARSIIGLLMIVMTSTAFSGSGNEHPCNSNEGACYGAGSSADCNNMYHEAGGAHKNCEVYNAEGGVTCFPESPAGTCYSCREGSDCLK